MGISPDALAQILAEKGISEEDIHETVGAFAKGKYDERLIEVKPAWYLETDKTAMIGERQIKIRAVNKADTVRILPKVVEMAKQIIFDEDMDIDPETLLENKRPQQFLGTVMKKVLEFKQATSSGPNMYPAWYVAVLEELSILATFDPDDPDSVVTINDIVAMSNLQFAQLVTKIWEVSKQDFLDLLGHVELTTGLPISSLVIRVTLMMKRVKIQVTKALKKSEADLEKEIKEMEKDEDLAKMKSELDKKHSSGGQESTGKSSTSSRSKKKKTSAKKSSTDAQLAASSS